MFKEKINNLKALVVRKTDGNNKKNIENLVVFLILLIITIIAINVIWDKKDETEENESTYKILADNIESSNTSNISNTNEYTLQEDIEDILSKMEGVGKVQVLITYAETSSIEAMYNETQSTSTTEETDSNGGIRTIESSDTKKEIITDDSNLPITQKIMMPKVEGAIVIAEGGGNALTKTNIVQAVSAVTGLSTYKVQVFEMKN